MKYLISVITAFVVFSCSNETKTVESISEEDKSEKVEEILKDISIDKKIETKQAPVEKLVIDLQFPLADTGRQVGIELFTEGEFAPILAENIDGQGKLTIAIPLSRYQLYRVVTQGKGVFVFSDEKEIKGKVKEIISAGNKAWDYETISSEETKQMQDFVIFSSELDRNPSNQLKLVSYLKKQKTGFVHYVNFGVIMQNAASQIEFIKRLKTDYANKEKYPYAKEYKQRFSMTPQVGDVAPEIELPSLNGGMAKLSDLKGKIVLLDFWASWCGPCRRENPNVVKLYNKYHEQGFEIFGVSLDKTKQAWKEAVQKDGLIWQHVSDLKFWQSQGAKTYKVQSIPQTFLIDQKGIIVAQGLRGAALEQKIAELLAK